MIGIFLFFFLLFFSWLKVFEDVKIARERRGKRSEKGFDLG